MDEHPNESISRISMFLLYIFWCFKARVGHIHVVFFPLTFPASPSTIHSHHIHVVGSMHGVPKSSCYIITIIKLIITALADVVVSSKGPSPFET